MRTKHRLQRRTLESQHPLARWMIRKRFTPHDLAERWGCTTQHVYGLLNGRHTPSTRLLLRIAQDTGLGFDALSYGHSGDAQNDPEASGSA